MTTGDGGGALEGLRVLDLADERGAYCTKLLADLGADVVRVEPPDGGSLRHLAPFFQDRPHVEGSLHHLFHNTNKRSLRLSLDDEEGRALFTTLAGGADVIVETLPPGTLDRLGLGYAALSRRRPQLIVVSLTPYGQFGPHSAYKGTDISAQAMGGTMAVTGEAARAPVRAAGYCGNAMASYVAAVATLGAVHSRDETGLGQHVDVSMQEAVAAQIEWFAMDYLFEGEVHKRAGTHHPKAHGVTIYPCKDGWFSCLGAISAAGAAWIGDERLADPRYLDPDVRFAEMALLDSIIVDFAKDKTRQELFHDGQRRGIRTGACLFSNEVVADPHLNARGFYVEVDHPHTGRMKLPGPPYELHGTPWRLRRPAPLLGQHDDEVRREAREIAARPQIPAAPGPTAGGVPAPSPLAGLRVLDCTVIMAGPITCKLLADLGADVLKVEGGLTLEGRGGGPWLHGIDTSPEGAGRWALFNRNKRSITLNWKTPEGLDLFKRLVALSDVVVDNFSSGTMAKLGLGYAALSEINPGIVMVELSGFGQTGPYRTYTSNGPILSAVYGHPELTGHPDGEPAQVGYTISDFMSPYHAAFAVLSALRHRRRSGRGQYIDAGQLQLGASLTAIAQLDYIANGRVQTRIGNRDPNASPHGCYRCQGDDRWCVIAVWTDEEWQALRHVLGDPDWAADLELGTAGGRLGRAADLDAHLEEWTSQRTADEVMETLQAAGVEAARVQDMRDIIDGDPHMTAREFYETFEHVLGEQVRVDGMPYKYSRTPVHVRNGGPLLGGDNDYAFLELLGLDAATLAEYEARGAVGA